MIEAVIPTNKIDKLIKIFEGYEGLGIVTTVSAKEGKIMIRFAPENKADVEAVFQDFLRQNNLNID